MFQQFKLVAQISARKSVLKERIVNQPGFLKTLLSEPFSCLLSVGIDAKSTPVLVTVVPSERTHGFDVLFFVGREKTEKALVVYQRGENFQDIRVGNRNPYHAKNHQKLASVVIEIENCSYVGSKVLPPKKAQEEHEAWISSVRAKHEREKEQSAFSILYSSEFAGAFITFVNKFDFSKNGLVAEDKDSHISVVLNSSTLFIPKRYEVDAFPKFFEVDPYALNSLSRADTELLENHLNAFGMSKDIFLNKVTEESYPLLTHMPILDRDFQLRIADDEYWRMWIQQSVVMVRNNNDSVQFSVIPGKARVIPADKTHYSKMSQSVFDTLQDFITCFGGASGAVDVVSNRSKTVRRIPMSAVPF